MRLRLKKNLNERMEDCKDAMLDSDCFVNALIAIQNPNYIDFAKVFGNTNPICLEIGCGKGKFAIEYALAHPDQNIIAIERLSNVIVGGAEKAVQLGLKNVKFLRQNAEFLPHFVSPKTISKIFLNFSCPYPKKSYKNRRLTYCKFLDNYKVFLTDNGCVEQKTDNLPFFEFSKESFVDNGWELKFVTYDLYSCDLTGNIQTEYERRFVSGGTKINKLIATPLKQKE